MTRKPLREKARSLDSALLGGLLLVATLSACGDADAGSPSPESSSVEESVTPSATVASLPDSGALEAGTYLVPSSAWSAVDYTITFPEGWRVRESNLFDSNIEQFDEFAIQPFVVNKIYADACKGDRGAQIGVGPGVDDLVDALLAQPGPAKTSAETTLGGYPATRVDLRVPDRLQTKNCFAGPGTGVQIWLNGPKNYLFLDPNGLLSIYVVDVDGERAVFTSQYKPAHTSPEDQAELQQVLDSIHIEK
jgi:hypothetical protein